ncbi:unnamed protein product [Pleuronectes platessa]|uniref:Uncharacterized protein n=1 Tax=Pleuronectes platessa TaxID=8262 RepID=A0A9N7VJB3_PLEPL|nr:unnamed protein product [Pleuronectes platessa]
MSGPGERRIKLERINELNSGVGNKSLQIQERRYLYWNEEKKRREEEEEEEEERVALQLNTAESSVFTLEYLSADFKAPPLPLPTLLYLSLLTLIHCSRALQFKALRNTHPHTPPLPKKLQPKLFLQPPFLPSSLPPPPPPPPAAE